MRQHRCLDCGSSSVIAEELGAVAYMPPTSADNSVSGLAECVGPRGAKRSAKSQLRMQNVARHKLIGLVPNLEVEASNQRSGIVQRHQGVSLKYCFIGSK
jgi:hypothetical protein